MRTQTQPKFDRFGERVGGLEPSLSSEDSVQALKAKVVRLQKRVVAQEMELKTLKAKASAPAAPVEAKEPEEDDERLIQSQRLHEHEQKRARALAAEVDEVRSALSAEQAARLRAEQSLQRAAASDVASEESARAESLSAAEALNAEIQRLRDENAQLQKADSARSKTLKAEIQRLREENTRLHAAGERRGELSDGLQAAEKSVEAERQNAAAVASLLGSELRSVECGLVQAQSAAVALGEKADEMQATAEELLEKLLEAKTRPPSCPPVSSAPPSRHSRVGADDEATAPPAAKVRPPLKASRAQRAIADAEATLAHHKPPVALASLGKTRR